MKRSRACVRRRGCAAAVDEATGFVSRGRGRRGGSASSYSARQGAGRRLRDRPGRVGCRRLSNAQNRLRIGVAIGIFGRRLSVAYRLKRRASSSEGGIWPPGRSRNPRQDRSGLTPALSPSSRRCGAINWQGHAGLRGFADLTSVASSLGFFARKRLTLAGPPLACCGRRLRPNPKIKRQSRSDAYRLLTAPTKWRRIERAYR
jgi:hypothetical protein